ncbi:DUF397 domain-containing protein [Streptomyces sp. NPDC096013]|uniref:DUF397 domain-containing protein n=1 Tax=Streptomyces sp. NPDC096013 TaxID=3366069 RepID=UPI00380F85B4
MDGSWSWRKSSFSDASGVQCVEVAWTGHNVLVRDSKDTAVGQLAFDATSWDRFISSTPATRTASAGN